MSWVFGRRPWIAAPLGLFALVPGRATASTIEVAPVLTDLAPGQMASVLTVTNRGAEAASVQVRAFEWSQPTGGTDGRDVLSPAADLLASPPIFTMPAGGAQAVRLLLRRPATGGERAFRLLVDEIPDAAGENRRQVRFALRLSLPVFAQSAANGAPELEWRLSGQRLSVRNRGQRRAQLFNMTLLGQGGARLPLREPEIPYVLAGAERHWVLRGSPPRPGTVLRAEAAGEAGRVGAEIVAAAG